jgi:hypothetical protein
MVPVVVIPSVRTPRDVDVDWMPATQAAPRGVERGGGAALAELHDALAGGGADATRAAFEATIDM